jgi:glutathione synthase/RimK-type ligase-like ATP-grasp enzyme
LQFEKFESIYINEIKTLKDDNNKIFKIKCNDEYKILAPNTLITRVNNINRIYKNYL